MPSRLGSMTVRRFARALHERFGIEIITTHLYARALGKSSPIPCSDEKSVSDWNEMRLQDSDYFARLIGMPAVDLRARLERGDRCYYIERNGELLHFSWAQYSGSHHLLPAGQDIDIERQQVCIYHCYTSPEARGRGLYPAALQRIIEESSAIGCHLAWIYTTDDNVASKRGIQKSGFVWVCTVRAIRIGRFHHWLSRIPRDVFDLATRGAKSSNSK